MKRSGVLTRVLVMLLGVTLAAGAFAGNGLGRSNAIASAVCNGVPATITGTEGNDTIAGTAGDDVIAALGGADTIDGGGGNDVVCGGLGNDSVNGNTGTDTVSFAGATKPVTVILASGKVTGADGTDAVSGVENVIGGSGADKLTGDAAGNAISGGGGNDVIDGGANGNDTLDGGAGTDTVSFAAAATAVNASLATGSATGSGTDTLGGFENVTGSTASDTLTADAGANVVDGNKGNDTLDGGPGQDTLSYASVTVGVTASLASGTASGGGGNDGFSGFEKLTGTAKNDALSGNDGPNTVDGGNGSDTCRLGNGADRGINCETAEGAVEAQGVDDTYDFSAKAGAAVFLDSQTEVQADCSNLEWTVGGAAALVPSVSQCYDRGPLAIPKSGTYTVRIASLAGSPGTGAYRLRWWPVPAPQVAAYTLGSEGRGNIETPGVEDQHTFAGAAGQRIFYDSVDADACGLHRTLVAPGGAVVAGADGFVCQDLGPVTLPTTGTYKLRVRPPEHQDMVGTYAFRVLVVPAPQTFAYTLGSTVSDGVPAAGAGKIESPQAEDVYTFVGSAGEKLFYDSLDAANCSFTRQLVAPDNSVVAGSDGANCQDAGNIVLPSSGTYMLRIFPGPNLDGVGAYSFNLSVQSNIQTFAYTIGSVVSDGVPAAGAGNIEFAGAEDDYTFTGSAGQRLFYDSLGATDCAFNRQLYGPGDVLVITGFVCQDNGAFTLPATGTYTLRVFPVANQTDTGTYSFRMLPVPGPEAFAYTIGATVSNGVPAPGAGNIETPQAEDRYTFSGTAGQKLFYDGLTATNCGISRQVVGPGDVTVLTGFVCQDSGAFTLPATGTYTVKVVPLAMQDIVGTYSFRLTTVPPPQTFAYVVGTTIDGSTSADGSGVIEVPQAEDHYTFTGTAGQVISYDAIGVAGQNCSFERHLIAPGGAEVFGGYVCQDVNAVTLPATGTYRLRINPVVNRQDTGYYKFRITSP